MSQWYNSTYHVHGNMYVVRAGVATDSLRTESSDDAKLLTVLREAPYTKNCMAIKVVHVLKWKVLY